MEVTGCRCPLSNISFVIRNALLLYALPANNRVIYTSMKINKSKLSGTQSFMNIRPNLQPVDNELVQRVQWKTIFFKQSVQDALVPSLTESFVKTHSF